MTSVTAHAPAHGGAHHAPMSFWRKYIFSTDHKIIGIQFLFVSLFFLLVGGILAMQIRWQLGFPGKPMPGGSLLPETMTAGGVVLPEYYIQLVTMHGTIMIFWVAMPVLLAAFGNFLIPLMLGCDDMVFPKVNRLSYQIFLLSAVVLVASFVVPGGAFGGAWTAYPPLSANAVYNLTRYGASVWVVAVALEFVAFLLGGVNFVTTAMNSRAPGMRMFDVPIVVWMIVIASILFMASVGPLLAGAAMLPVNGPAWQAMRLSRNRNWGHPDMVRYVERLAIDAKEKDGWPGLMVGDLAQPRGGPMLTGHASHQVGLDAEPGGRERDRKGAAGEVRGFGAGRARGRNALGPVRPGQAGAAELLHEDL